MTRDVGSCLSSFILRIIRSASSAEPQRAGALRGRYTPAINYSRQGANEAVRVCVNTIMRRLQNLRFDCDSISVQFDTIFTQRKFKGVALANDIF